MHRSLCCCSRYWRTHDTWVHAHKSRLQRRLLLWVQMAENNLSNLLANSATGQEDHGNQLSAMSRLSTLPCYFQSDGAWLKSYTKHLYGRATTSEFSGGSLLPNIRLCAVHEPIFITIRSQMLIEKHALFENLLFRNHVSGYP